MKSKYTTEKFIAMAIEKHGTKYDYSKSVYTGGAKKLIVICPEHGEFLVRASHHTTVGNGCSKCSHKKPRIRKKEKYENLGRPIKSTEEFIEQAKSVHGNTFDYSETKYIHSKIHVTIICPIHGKFTQRPTSHTAGFGCQQCRTQKILS